MAKTRATRNAGLALWFEAGGLRLAHLRKRANASFVAGAPRLDALADPGFLFGKLFVELGVLPAL